MEKFEAKHQLKELAIPASDEGKGISLKSEFEKFPNHEKNKVKLGLMLASTCLPQWEPKNRQDKIEFEKELRLNQIHVANFVAGIDGKYGVPYQEDLKRRFLSMIEPFSAGQIYESLSEILGPQGQSRESH